MSKSKNKPMPIEPKAAAKEIINILGRILSSGHRPSEIFDDWIEQVQASLKRLPHLAQASAEGKSLPPDPPDIQKMFERMHSKYTPVCHETFSKALAQLVIAAEASWEDILGDVYMQWGAPSNGLGQFFTPWSVASMMAHMTMGDIEQQIHERIKAAATKTIVGQALLMSSLIIDTPADAQEFFFTRLLPAVLQDVEPITICDPTVGSGVMLLAAAECVPTWALQLGLVQFFGMDIDQTCVTMAKINVMLHGLNGYGLECADALTNPLLLAMPIAEEVYAPLKDAPVEVKQEVSRQLRTGQYQMNLFETEAKT